MVRVTVLGTISLPSGGPIQLLQRDYGQGGNLVSIISGVHGDEYLGLYVVYRLIQWLESIEQSAYQLRGRIRIVGCANPLGALIGERLWPADFTDLNRIFPGYQIGEASQRLAHWIFDALKPSLLSMDLHNGTAMHELLHARSYSRESWLQRGMYKMGLPAIWYQSFQEPSARYLEVPGTMEGTLQYCLHQHGVENMVLCGGPDLDIKQGVQLFRGLLKLLFHLEILKGPPLEESEPVQECRPIKSITPILSQRGGLFLAHGTLGEWVKKGSYLGETVDIQSGQILEQIFSPVEGLLLSLRKQPMVGEGMLLARIA
jgi:predicted deacylase